MHLFFFFLTWVFICLFVNIKIFTNKYLETHWKELCQVSMWIRSQQTGYDFSCSDLLAEIHLWRNFHAKKGRSWSWHKSWIRLQPVHWEKDLLQDKYIFTFLTDVSKTGVGGLGRCWNIVSAVCDSKQQCRWRNSQLNCRALINLFKNIKRVILQKQAKPQQRVTNLPNKTGYIILHEREVTQKSFPLFTEKIKKHYVINRNLFCNLTLQKLLLKSGVYFSGSCHLVLWL